MSIHFEVDRVVDLGSGFELVAPGYRGHGRATEPSDYAAEASRSATTQRFLTDELSQALDRAGMREDKAIELTLVPEPGSTPQRSHRQEDAVVLMVPDLGEDRGQVVMLTDEDGGVSFHYPVDSTQTIQPPTTRGAGGMKTFVIPAEVTPGTAPDGEATRGWLHFVGGKLVQVLSFPVARLAGAAVGEPLVRRWEKANRPYGITWFGPDDYRSGEIRPVDDWTSLADGRALLFIHGTFSTASGGFGAIPKEVMARLWDAYEGRVIAFEHPTLSSDPVENVAWLVEAVPPDLHLDLDVIAHSRGGLVARVLDGGMAHADLDLDRVAVHSVVCVGTPNYGTPLADADHLSSLCDRLATASNLVPGFGVSEVMDVVLILVQHVAQATLEGLSGLQVMRPGSDFLRSLNTARRSASAYFGIAANYEPRERGLKRIVEGLKDGAVDFVFRGAPNDLVVPTLGVYSGDHPFRIDSEKVVNFDESRGVMHATFWREPEVATAFSDWLGA